MFKVLWLPESISSQTGGYMIQLLILKTKDIPILTYLMANKAHYRGLTIDLKTAGSIFGDVLPIVEWHVNEQCLQHSKCDKFIPFIHQNKLAPTEHRISHRM
jgi:hypothetical protein